MTRDVTRRTALALTAAVTPLVAGCQDAEPSSDGEDSSAATDTTDPTRRATGTETVSEPRGDGPDIAATYQLGHGQWGDCMAGSPNGGRYEQVVDDVATRHRAAFRAARVGRVRTQFPAAEGGRRRLAAFLDRTELDVDLVADVVRAAGAGDHRAFVPDLADVSAGGEAVAGVVVPVRSLRGERAGDVRDRLRDDYGSLPAFADWLRSALSDRRIVAQVGMPGVRSLPGQPVWYRETVGRFDAVTNAAWPPRASDSPGGTFAASLRDTFQALREFARHADSEFEPTVASGLPTGVDACTDGGPRAVPRDPVFCLAASNR
ncbi:hypothetical protein [Halostella salina]|uniref:hypothetical protein n=1 Tax=Halostella salina TaxID=1547897 RepID=UPI000EF78C95|nr:hypothetical protein [Halostella salina]